MSTYKIRILTPEQADDVYARQDNVDTLVDQAVTDYFVNNGGGGGGGGGGVNTVNTTGDQVIEGTKIFINAPTVPANAFPISAVASLSTTLAGKVDLIEGKISPSVLPPLSINEVYTVGSQTAMLALTAERGDMVIRTDINKTFVLSSDNPGILAEWKELVFPVAVSSVNGKTGVVVVSKTDINLGNVDNTADLAKPVSNATATALNAKENTLVPGANITIDRSNPAAPVISSSGGGGTGAWADITGKPTTFAPTIGTTSTTAVAGNDPRLIDQRVPTDNSVTSAKIVDGTILDVDINATAAIAQSKIANLTTDLAAKANAANAALTGNPTAPTPATADNDTSIATTAFVRSAISNYAPTSPIYVVYYDIAQGTWRGQGDVAVPAAAPAGVLIRLFDKRGAAVADYPGAKWTNVSDWMPLVSE